MGLPFLLLLAAFGAVYVGIGWITARVSGWQRLAAAYPATGWPDGPPQPRYTMILGQATLESLVEAVPTEEGWYFRAHPIGRPFLPAWCVPWAAVRLVEAPARKTGTGTYLFTVDLDPPVRLGVSERYVQRYLRPFLARIEGGARGGGV